MRRLPRNALPARGKIADGACKRHDAGLKTQEKEKNGHKNGNEPSHDETFPHRTYIEMKKLSRILERGLLVSLSPLFMMQMYALLMKLPNKSAIFYA